MRCSEMHHLLSRRDVRQQQQDKAKLLSRSSASGMSPFRGRGYVPQQPKWGYI